MKSFIGKTVRGLHFENDVWMKIAKEKKTGNLQSMLLI